MNISQLPLGLQQGRQKALPSVLTSEVTQHILWAELTHKLKGTFSNNTMLYMLFQVQLKQLQEFYLHQNSALIKTNSVNSAFHAKNLF